MSTDTNKKEDPRLQIMDTDRPRQTAMRIRSLAQQRSERSRLRNIAEGAKSELKVVELTIEHLTGEVVRLSNRDDDLNCMQKYIEFGDD